ncbi:hypothetical protein MASR1M74_00910 [Lentimicrobium sp.]
MRAYLLLFLLCSSMLGAAQNDAGVVKLGDLEMPASPAFMLLDAVPTVIERPATARAFVLGIVNSVNQSGGLPQNYAVEFTPFWFFRHPHMTSLKYHGYNATKDKQTPFSNISKGALSMAVVQTHDSTYSRQNISFGLRTNLFTLKRREDIEALKAANYELVGRLRDQQARLVEYIGDLMLSVENPELYKQKVREFFEQEELNHMDEKSRIADILDRKPLLSLDVAGALNLAFQNQKFSSGSIGRAGAWLTAQYAQPFRLKNTEKENYLNVYVLMRYLNDERETGQLAHYFDAGGKAEIELHSFSFGYEYIWRKTSKANTFRSSGEIRYRISEVLSISAAFGRNFGNTNNLIALLGLQWGFNTGNEQVAVMSPR